MVVTDESLGALMRHMKELGVLDNTVIIVKGDHGVIEKSFVRVPDLLFMIDVVLSLLFKRRSRYPSTRPLEALAVA